MRLKVHGMARIAWEDCNVYVNGRCRGLAPGESGFIETICRTRELARRAPAFATDPELLEWMLKAGAFEIPGNL
jgi:hypothetical protein